MASKWHKQIPWECHRVHPQIRNNGQNFVFFSLVFFAFFNQNKLQLLSKAQLVKKPRQTGCATDNFFSYLSCNVSASPPKAHSAFAKSATSFSFSSANEPRGVRAPLGSHKGGTTASLAKSAALSTSREGLRGCHARRCPRAGAAALLRDLLKRGDTSLLDP